VHIVGGVHTLLVYFENKRGCRQVIVLLKLIAEGSVRFFKVFQVKQGSFNHKYHVKNIENIENNNCKQSLFSLQTGYVLINARDLVNVVI